MQVRKIINAYQWRFPRIRANTADPINGPFAGEMDGFAVGLWTCKPDQWNDGICDLNCGRFDVDCAGPDGIPGNYEQTLRT